MAGRERSRSLRHFFSSTDPAYIRCSSTELGNFTKQLNVLLAAGIPIHEALHSMTGVDGDSLSIWVTPELRYKLTNGQRFSSALREFPRVFPKIYVALIRGAEESGQLVKVLELLEDWLEKQNKLEKQLKKALTYPLFVISLALGLTLLLFKTVIPGLLDTVVGLGGELPVPTQILMTIILVLDHPLFWFLLLVLVVCIVLYLRNPEGYQQFLRACQYVPILGGILTYAGGARYSHTLGMLLTSGVDIIRAARFAADASGNVLIQEDAYRVVKALSEGTPFSDILGDRLLYPPLLIDMVKVGDETGRMADLVGRSGVLLEDDTMHRVGMMMNLLEPVVLGGVSLLVGSVLVAIVMPMSNILTAL